MANITGQSPWDESALYAAPVEAFTGLVGNTAKMILTRDPMRVSLIVSLTGSLGNVGITTTPNPAAVQGWLLTSNSPVMPLHYSDWGALVQGEWWAFTANTQSIAVITQSMKDWNDGITSPIDKYLATGVRRPAPPVPINTVPGVKGGMGVIDYWYKITGGQKEGPLRSNIPPFFVRHLNRMRGTLVHDIPKRGQL